MSGRFLLWIAPFLLLGISLKMIWRWTQQKPIFDPVDVVIALLLALFFSWRVTRRSKHNV